MQLTMNDGSGDDLDRWSPPGRGLRALDTALTVAFVVLAAFSVLLVIAAGPVIAGFGTVTLDTEASLPYTVTFADGTSVEVSDEGSEWSGSPIGKKGRLADEPTVLAGYDIGKDDHDARAVLVAGIAAGVALSWVGLVNARRIVRSTRDGHPFEAANVGRLRRIAAAVVVFPFVGWAMGRGVDHTLEEVLAVHLRLPGPSWLTYLLAGLGLLALAEVFREGSRLRELDEATI